MALACNKPPEPARDSLILLLNPRDALLLDCFQNAKVPSKGKSSYQFKSVGTRFKGQLGELMATLSAMEPHYIRCVKPNSFNKPALFEPANVVHQLRCGGVLEAVCSFAFCLYLLFTCILSAGCECLSHFTSLPPNHHAHTQVRISCAGYPSRREFSEFIDHFWNLGPELLNLEDDREIVKKLLSKVKVQNFQLGKTKVFLKSGHMAILDKRRHEVMSAAATAINRVVRGFLERSRYKRTRQAVITLQVPGCRPALNGRPFLLFLPIEFPPGNYRVIFSAKSPQLNGRTDSSPSPSGTHVTIDICLVRCEGPRSP